MSLESRNREMINVLAKDAGIVPQHASRLLRMWKKVGWIEKRPTLHGSKFFYTTEGKKIKCILAPTIGRLH